MNMQDSKNNEREYERSSAFSIPVSMRGTFPWSSSSMMSRSSSWMMEMGFLVLSLGERISAYHQNGKVERPWPSGKVLILVGMGVKARRGWGFGVLSLTKTCSTERLAASHGKEF